MDRQIISMTSTVAMNRFMLCGYCNRRRWSALASVAAMVFFLFHPAPLIGDSDQDRAAKEYHRAKIRSALELQDTTMSPAALVALAESVMAASEKNSLDPMLVLAIIQVESQFNHKAISPQGAQGLMQVQPAAVKTLVEEGKMPQPQRGRNINLINPAVNVQVGASYLALLKENFGDLRVALTAYNLGPTWVSKKLAARQALPSDYARKVLATQHSLENRLALNGGPAASNSSEVTG
jgi:soluble lytic murein transglycosylase-like protein